MLDRHPDVLCHYEIFHRKMQVQRKKAPGLTNADLALRASDPNAFAARILAESGGRAAVGFKMWRGQAPEACRSLLGRKDVHKIVLERQNVLARYSSHLLAHRNRVWGTRVGKVADVDTRPLETFDPSAFRELVRHQDATFRFYQRFAAGPLLYITYEQLAVRGVADVLPFLQLSPDPIEHGYQKLYSSDIIGRFAPNLHAEIRSELREVGRPEWVSENTESAPPLAGWPSSRPSSRKRLTVPAAAKWAKRLFRGWLGAR
jgi:hypothetical protein